MNDDRHLVQLLKRGDLDAFRDIYSTYRDALLTMAMCLLGDWAVAEDVLHEVFVGLATGNGRMEVRKSLKGYLIACVANRCRDHFRRNARPNQSHPIPLEDAGEVASAAVDPSAQLVQHEEAGALYRALAELPFEQREVIMLHLHGSMTFKEIVRRQGVSINTAQGRYRYGIDRLRSVLQTEA